MHSLTSGMMCNAYFCGASTSIEVAPYDCRRTIGICIVLLWDPFNQVYMCWGISIQGRKDNDVRRDDDDCIEWDLKGGK